MGFELVQPTVQAVDVREMGSDSYLVIQWVLNHLRLQCKLLKSEEKWAQLHIWLFDEPFEATVQAVDVVREMGFDSYLVIQ